MTVSSVTVNEASPYAVIKVSGTATQAVTLDLNNVTTTGLSGLEYFDGSTWQTYSSNQSVTLDSTGELLVRVSLQPEQDPQSDSGETFIITATPSGGLAASGTATIVDDGTGSYFATDNNTDVPAVPTGVSLDDDRAVTVSSVTVNEASPYAVIKVSGTATQAVTLDLNNVTTTGLSGLEYFDGSTWQTYSSNQSVTLDSAGELLVRVSLQPEQDPQSDSGETFIITATPAGGSAASGTATIVDDGTGSYFATDNTTDVSAVPTGVSLDDDRAVTVSSVTVNEASPYAVIKVSGTATQAITLALNNVTTTGLTGLEYFDGSTWQTYSSNQSVTLDSAGELLVRVSLQPEQDSQSDSGETFTITATPTGGSAASGTAMIVDDGTGSYFATDNTTDVSAVPTGVSLDDDRAVTVSSVTVNEASPYAVIKVSGTATQAVTLDLNNVTTTGLSGLEYFDGSTWQTYSSNQSVTLDSTGELLVRVSLQPEQDSQSDSGETFTITATPSGGSAASGAATIVDDGTGSYFAANNNTGISSLPTGVKLDNDATPHNEPAPPVATQPTSSDTQGTSEPVAVASEPVVITSQDLSLTAPVPSSLMVLRNIPEQQFNAGDGFTSIRVLIPADTFGHTDTSEIIQLNAVMETGEPLPDWLIFDANSGEFRGIPPKGFVGSLMIKVVARDNAGAQVETIITIEVGQQQTEQNPTGKKEFYVELKADHHMTWAKIRHKLMQAAEKLKG